MKASWPILTAVLVGALVLAVGLPSGSGAVSAQDLTPAPTERTVTVTGTGSVSATPNLALVTLGVETDAAQAATALSQNNQQIQAVVTAVTNAGVAAADVQTRVVQLPPRYAQPEATTGQVPTPPTSRGQVVGYTALNMVEVRVRNVSQLGSLIDAAVTAGANRVEGINFQVENPTNLLTQARQAAWNDALNTARQLATLAGSGLGQVMTITESTTGPIPVATDLRQGGAVPISPGSVNVETTVRVTWLLSGTAATPPAGATVTPTRTLSLTPLATMTVSGAPTASNATPLATMTIGSALPLSSVTPGATRTITPTTG